MSGRERLEDAYENVAFSADRTWTNKPGAYQRLNLELYLTENYLQRTKLKRRRPRTVRECIPGSRLAQYSDFGYHESRELCYTQILSRFLNTTNNVLSPSEPWTLSEVDSLFKWFLENQPQDRFSRLQWSYESPLLNVHCFEERALKLKITQNSIKSIWYRNIPANHNNDFTKINETVIDIYKSSLGNFHVCGNGKNRVESKWQAIAKDFEDIKNLTNSIRDLNSTLWNVMTRYQADSSMSSVILYSEVLQGVTPSKRTLCSSQAQQDNGHSSNLKHHSDTVTNFAEFTLAQDSNSQSSSFLQSTTYFNSNVACNYADQNTARASSPQAENISAWHFSRWQYTTQSYQLSAWSPSYLQTHLFPQLFPVQRPNLPTHLVTMPWFPQTQAQMGGNVPKANFKYERRDWDSSFYSTYEDNYDVPNSSFSQDGVAITNSASEELSVQALEQYEASNDSLNRELEREAIEHYEGDPC